MTEIVETVVEATSRTDEAIASAIEATQQTIGSAADKLSEIAAQYGEPAFEITMKAYVLEGVRNLLHGFAWVVLGVLLSVFVSSFLYKKGESIGWGKESSIPFGVSTVISVVLGSLLILTNLSDLFDAWNWYALIDPPVAAAHKLLGM